MNECETCGHPIRGIANGAPTVISHGMEFVMIGVCEECPECIREAQERVAEDRNARPAQYRPD